ncbi:hypothetical protein B7H23_04640 [Notoacmeibacter marinus]|uniref:Uncharacterized protein n=1 Tax=Notoacmeibacter marinus TaxID=1876515 RepID=A0A231V1Z3_9HYPH|nr:hypothetical protein [Notoacmeibacter marinus]OXT02208.1 hypothetical protein B7H23_04640 [Notoacmeibacter marinus]
MARPAWVALFAHVSTLSPPARRSHIASGRVERYSAIQSASGFIGKDYAARFMNAPRLAGVAVHFAIIDQIAERLFQRAIALAIKCYAPIRHWPKRSRIGNGIA